MVGQLASMRLYRAMQVGLLMAVLAVAILAQPYIAATNGTPGGAGTEISPWDLQTAITQSLPAGSVLYLRGGTYTGRFVSSLTGSVPSPIVVRSYPGEWAKIDGYWTNTLNGGIDSSQTSIVLTNAAGVQLGHNLEIDSENVYVTDINGNTLTVVRGWAATTPATHSNGALVWIKENTLVINGSDTWYRDFEIYDSNPNRSFGTTGDPSNRKGGDGIMIFGPRTKIINMIIHDAQDGIFRKEQASDTELYGNITYNNGFVDLVRGQGHGMYIQNQTGTCLVTNNISFNNYAEGMKAFGEGGYANNVTFRRNIAFNNKSPGTFVGNPSGYATTDRFGGIFLGTAVNPPTNGVIDQNHSFNSDGTTVELGNIGIGYLSSGGTGLTVTDNRAMGGSNAMPITGFAGVTGSGNKIYSDGFLVPLSTLGAGIGGYSWNNNTYYDTSPVGAVGFRYAFSYNEPPIKTNQFGGGILNYDDVGDADGKGWKQWTGFDANSTYTEARPIGTETFVYANAYEAGRANIVVWNWDANSTVNVSLTNAGLSGGQQFEIRNVTDYLGTPVLSNQTYSNGMSVTLPMTGLVVATPIGSGFTPPNTAPTFAVFVVVPLTAGGGVKGKLGGGIKMTGAIQVRG